MRYRSKPVEVDAITFEELEEIHKPQIDAMESNFIVINYGVTALVRHEKGYYRIPTDREFIGMLKGDVLVESKAGFLSVMKGDEFRAKYEAIDNVR